MKKITRKFTTMVFVLALLGLNNVFAQQWTNYTSADGLVDDLVLSVAIDALGNKWFGQVNGNVTKFDDTNWTSYTLPNNGKNDVYSIAFDISGDKWFATGGSGVNMFDNTDITNYLIADGLANNNVQSMVIDGAGNKWFTTEGGGVSMYDNTNWTTYTSLDGLASDYVYSSAIESSGNIWFGTLIGLSMFDGTNWTTYTTTDGLVNKLANSIAIDDAGNKWFGTNGGVSKFDGINWTNYTTTDGLVSNNVYSIAIDAAGNKWFGTNAGVSKFDGINWINYSTTDGLVNNYVNSIDIDNDGSIWFGTNGGVSKFIENAAPVAVTGVTLNTSALEIKVSISSSLTAAIIPINATNKNVTWSTSNPSVATVSNGIVTGIMVGTAKIIVSTVDGGFTDTCDVTIAPIITGVTLSSSSLSLEISESSMLTGTLTPTGVICDDISWYSNDATVATVSNGLVTGVKGGTTKIIIIASEDKDHTFSDTCDVTVAPAAPVDVTGVTLNNSTLEIGVSSSSSLTTTITPLNATNKNVTWSTSDPSVATVSEGLVTGIKIGIVKIIVTTVDGGFKDTCDIIISDNVLSDFTTSQQILNIYPNPSTNLITISTNSYPAILSITDISGRIKKQLNITSPETTIDISSLDIGIYLINIQKGNSISVSKLLKE